MMSHPISRIPMTRIVNNFTLLAGLTLLVFATAEPTFAQNPQQAAMLKAQQDAMAKMAFLAGEWEGTGWMDMGQGRAEYRSHEIVESRLDGLVLVVEGTHEADVPGQAEPRVVHHAVAMITFDPIARRYNFNSQVHQGGTGMYHGDMDGDAFVWGMSFGTMHMRYTIRLDEEGRWYEIGERSTDGENWTAFMGMTLERK